VVEERKCYGERKFEVERNSLGGMHVVLIGRYGPTGLSHAMVVR
jgi:hypothetical protein